MGLLLILPTRSVKCKLYDKVMQGGIYRLKQHVAHEGKLRRNAKATTQEAKEKFKKALDDAKKEEGGEDCS
jgi:hypothetical protein